MERDGTSPLAKLSSSGSATHSIGGEHSHGSRECKGRHMGAHGCPGQMAFHFQFIVVTFFPLAGP